MSDDAEDNDLTKPGTTSRRTFARLMFSFEGSTFTNLYLENFTQKNKKTLLLMR